MHVLLMAIGNRSITPNLYLFFITFTFFKMISYTDIISKVAEKSNTTDKNIKSGGTKMGFHTN